MKLDYGHLGSIINSFSLAKTNIDNFLTQKDLDIINKFFADEYFYYTMDIGWHEVMKAMEWLLDDEVAESGEWRKVAGGKTYTFIANEDEKVISFAITDKKSTLMVISKPDSIVLSNYKKDGSEDLLYIKDDKIVEQKGNMFTFSDVIENEK